MGTENLANVGDVITSQKFCYGHYEQEDKKFITIDGRTTMYPVRFCVSEEERVATAAKSGKVPPETRTVELGAYDPSRAEAEFVVEAANMQGGGTDHGPHDAYIGGWHVQARRLNDDGSYNPNGEVIRFYMSGDFICKVEPDDVRVIGRMQMRFV